MGSIRKINMHVASNGMVKAHGGILIESVLNDPFDNSLNLNVEAFTIGNKACIEYYYYDNMLNAKVGVISYRGSNGETSPDMAGCIVEFFKNAEDVDPYRRHTYRGYIRTPSKYYQIIKYIDHVAAELYKR